MPTVTVLAVEKHNGEWFPERLVETIEWLQEKLASIPKEYREVATIDVGSSTEYDGHTATVEISYTRPETQAEKNVRVSRTAHELAARAENEHKQYLALKAKFEGSV